MKQILLTFILGIFLISCASAMQIDNWVFYDDDDLTFKIKNGLGLGKEIGRGTLMSHKSTDEIRKVIAGENVGVMRYSLTKGINLDGIRMVNLYNGEDINRNYYFNKIIFVERQIPITSISCENINEEGCTSKVIGYRNIIEEHRERYDKNIIDEDMVLELVAQVNPGDYIDGIWKFEGKEISKHAGWQASMNVSLLAVYEFDQSSGNVTNEVDGRYNLTVQGTPTRDVVTEILPNGMVNADGFNFTGTNDLINMKNKTYIFWINNTGGNFQFFASLAQNDRFRYASGGTWLLQIGGTIVINGLSDQILADEFTMVTVAIDSLKDEYGIFINDTQIFLGVNASSSASLGEFCLFGNCDSSEPMTGEVTDVKIWNRSLTQAEISEQFNSGIGLGYLAQEIPDITVSLDLPTSGTTSINSTTIFDGSFVLLNGNFTNATMQLFNSSKDLLSSNFSIITGNSSNFSNLSISNIEFGDYEWNYFVCANNSLGNVTCSYATSNSTLNISRMRINSQTFSGETTEGNTEEFVIDFTIAESLTVATANLIYNGTSNNAVLTNPSGDNYLANQSITIPNLEVSNNLSFFWNIIFTDGSEFNTTLTNQSVSIISVDDCSANSVKLLNLTLVDEESQLLITPNINISNTTIDIALSLYNSDRTSLILNFSQGFNNTNPVEVCLNVNLTSQSNYILDSIIRYEATTYAIEYYNLVDFIVTNSSIPQSIVLFDLLSADSTEFKITFTDKDFVKVENALIFIDRQYVAEDLFKTVELPKTDSNGETVGHFVRNDVVYNIIVIKNGEIIGSFQNIIAFCDDFTIGACIIPLEATSDSNFGFGYNDVIGLSFSESPVYNATTSTMSFTFATSSGNVETVFMNVTRNDVFGNQSLCSTSLTSASGTLVCSVNPSIDDTLLVTTVSVAGVTSLISNTSINTTNFGSLGYLVWFIFTLFFILALGEYKTGVYFGLLMSYIGALAYGLIERTLFGVGASGIWIIVITIMGVYQLNKERIQ